MTHAEAAITKIIIEPLANHHNKTDFTCAEETLNHYLKRQAKEDVKRRISRVFVAVYENKPNSILGYYTLSSLSIDLSLLPAELAKKLPKYTIPCALIGRLAVDSRYQGNGIGKLLLADALKRTLSLSYDIDIYAMIVDALNDNAQQYYEKFGFCKLDMDTRRLYLPLKSI